MPIFYFTQLLGLAMGCTPGELSLASLVVPPGAPPRALVRVPRNGRYERRGDHAHLVGAELGGELDLVALAQPGEIVTGEQTIATVLSSRPLYDTDGAPLAGTDELFRGSWSTDAEG